ncbi:STAS domain-containing protein [Nonomuraea zeae]|uniref:STAS domain-containing protein n=1 Tax=Nonomuraea zeae TaxID=1642303 RepID=UPI0014797638|nr:STAS domain-containing protein [Nonomuraea zeae]
MPTVHPFGLRVSGEVDRSTRHLLEQALAWATDAGQDDIHLDLTQLTFIDAAGLRLIVATAAGLPAPRKLVLMPPPPVVRDLLSLLGWQLSPGLRLYVPKNGSGRSGDDDRRKFKPISPSDPAT